MNIAGPAWNMNRFDGICEEICLHGYVSLEECANAGFLCAMKIHLCFMQQSLLPPPVYMNNVYLSHKIHVWYIYLHFVDFYGKYTIVPWILWV